MSNSIENNAYRILGLDVNASQKDILKRYKEITNRLKIDDFPTYDLDFELPNKSRNEDSVNDAFKRLQNLKNSLKEYFFWFSVSDTVDEKSVKFLQNNDISKAIQTWKNALDDSNSTAYFYKKNLAVLYCLLLFKQSNATYLKESIGLWNDIINSDKFWIVFTKKYGLNNEQTLSLEVISDFRKSVVKSISDIYTDLYQHHKDSKYVKSFQEVFSTHGEKTEKNLLKPVYQSIYGTIDLLNKIKFNDEESKDEEEPEDKCYKCGDTGAEKYSDYDDGSILCDKCHKKIGKQWQKRVDDNAEETVEGSQKIAKRIQKVINKLQSQLDQLQKTGLYEDNQSKVVRDHVAEAIRNASVMMHNEAHMYKRSIELFKLAIKLSGTESIKEKYESELKVIKKNADNEEKSSLVLEIPKFWSNKNIIFKNNFAEYDRKKMYYKDVVAMSYHGVRNSTYGIETSQKYTFSIMSSNDKITFTFSGDEDLWYKLIDIAKQVIEPVIIEKLVKLIFEKEQTFSIGNVDFDKKGYHRSKFFGGVESVFWKDTIYIPQFSQGYVVLFKNKDGVGKKFTTISMEDSNAVVLPELLKACVEEYTIHNQK